MLNQEAIRQQLLELHQTMFRVETDETGGPFFARAAFCSRSPENLKENPGHRYTGITNELVYFAQTDCPLTAAVFRDLSERAFSEARQQIRPNLRHRMTDVTLFILSPQVDAEAAIAVCSHRQRVVFKLTLFGTMELRVYVVDCQQAATYSNRWGRSLKKYLDRRILGDKVNLE